MTDNDMMWRTSNGCVFRSEVVDSLSSHEFRVLYNIALSQDIAEWHGAKGCSILIRRSDFPSISKNRWSGRKDTNPPYPGILRRLEELGLIQIVENKPGEGARVQCTFDGETVLQPSYREYFRHFNQAHGEYD